MVKNKIPKNFPTTKKGTLDQMHTEQINKFSSLYGSLPDKRNRIIKLQNELNVLMQKEPEKYTKEDIHQKSELIDIIAQINSEIISIETCSEPLKYIAETLPILINYYDNANLVDDNMEEFVDVVNASNKKNILNYLMKETKIPENKIDLEEKDRRTNKAQLYNDYLNATDLSHKKIQKKNQIFVHCRIVVVQF